MQNKHYHHQFFLYEEIAQKNPVKYKKICHSLFGQNNEVALSLSVQEIQKVIQEFFQDTSIVVTCVEESKDQGSWFTSTIVKQTEFLPSIVVSFHSDRIHQM